MSGGGYIDASDARGVNAQATSSSEEHRRQVT